MRVMLRNAAFLMGGNIGGLALSLVLWLILPRVLGPGTFGEFTLAFAISGLAFAIGGLGITTFLVKEIARDRAQASTYVSTGIATQVALAALILIGVSAFTFLARYSVHTRVVVLIALAMGACSFLVAPASSALQALEEMHLNSMIGLGRQLAVALTVVPAALILRLNIIDLMLVVLTLSVLASLVQLWITHRVVGLHWRMDQALTRRFIIGGLPFWSNGVFLTIYVWIDSVLLSVFTPTREVGYYGASVQALSTLGFLPAIVTTAIFPALSRRFNEDVESMRHLARLSLIGLVSLGMPISVGAALVGPRAVALLLGPSYRPSGPVVVVLALTVVPVYIATLAYWVLAAANRQRLWAYVMGVMAVVNPAINLFTIPYFQSHTGHGSIGAAVALLITDTAVGAAGIAIMARTFLKPVRPLIAATARSILATATMAVPVWLLRDSFLLFPVLIGIAVFALTAFALGVFAGDGYEEIWAMLNARVARRGWRQREADSPA